MLDMRKDFWESPAIIKEFETRKTSNYITDEIEYLMAFHTIQKVADIGCGGGRYSKYLKNKNIDIIAVDRHPELSRSLLSYNIPFLKAEMDSIPLKSTSFDLVLSIGVLHNALSIEEFELAVSEISRIMKSNSSVICSVFTNDKITNDLSSTADENLFMISDKLPMLLLSKQKIDAIFNEKGLKKKYVIDEHITNVGIGERYVYTTLYQKR